MPSGEAEKEIEIASFKPFLKKYWRVGLLVVILVFAFYLRVYHADYPVIGYHNWKEIHYLGEARNFAEEGFFKYGFFVPYVDYLSLDGNQDGAHSDSFPSLSIIIGFFFKIFGINLLVARLITILFSLGAILFLYLFVKEISNRDDLAFLSSFLFAMNPLHVFFGRTVELDNLALFFIIASFYAYIKWIKSDKSKFLILTALFFSLSILTKYSFFLALFPMLFIFPYKKLKSIKVNFKAYLIAFLFLLTIPLWFYYSDVYIANKLGQPGAVSARIFDFGSFFSGEIWNSFKQYVPDNYTWIGLIFAFIGVGLLMITGKRKGFDKFIYGYVVGLPIWFFFMAGKLEGHSYHHYPLLPLFVILLAFSFLMISSLVTKIVYSFITNKTSSKFFKYLLVLVLIILIWKPSMEAKDRQFNTQFIGLDVAGDYIREHSDINDKLFHSTHQSHGVLWYANRQGYNLPNSITDLEKGEELGSKWLFIYQWGFSITQNSELWQRIKDTYSLRQIAFTAAANNQASPVYFLLEKGGNFDENNLNSIIQNAQVNIRTYEYTTGKVEMGYINI